MTSRILIGGAAVTFYVTLTLTAYRIQRIRNNPTPNAQIADPIYQSQTFPNAFKKFSEISSDYDQKIDTDEYFLGILSKRKKLIALAKGRTLEISAGTGRNLPYYPAQSNSDSLTLTDISPEMLQLSQKTYLPLQQSLPHTTFNLQDATSLQYPSNSFDTVIDTFGLCSTPSPSSTLKEMIRVTKTGGKILLLEHGRCEYSFVNEVLDKGLEEHAKNWGCFWNRDIDGIVKEAGLDVEVYEKYHFGTMSYVVAVKK